MDVIEVTDVKRGLIWAPIKFYTRPLLLTEGTAAIKVTLLVLCHSAALLDACSEREHAFGQMTKYYRGPYTRVKVEVLPDTYIH